MLSNARSKRTVSGGRYRAFRGKRLYEKASASTLPRIGEKSGKVIRAYGGRDKLRVILAATANVIDPKTKKASIVKIKNVVENPGNVNYVRRNILTKGTVIETEAGKARVTNSPGREGAVNAVLIQ